MPNPRHLVPPPAAIPRPFGLLSVAEVRDDADPHWRNGIEHETTCGTVGATWDGCAVEDDVPAKTGVRGVPPREASAITLYAADPCSTGGRSYRAARERATQVLLDGEGPALESLTESGRVSPLTGASPVPDDAMPLTFAADGVVAPGGLSASIAAAVASAEQYARSGLVGSLGVLHLPSAVASFIGDRLIRSGSRLETTLGTPVLAGNYLARSDLVPVQDGPDDASLAYLWVTGPLVVYRGEVVTVGSADRDAIDRTVNDRTVIVERTYAVSWGCRTIAIPFPLSELLA